jgi:hypothetical protein
MCKKTPRSDYLGLNRKKTLKMQKLMQIFFIHKFDTHLFKTAGWTAGFGHGQSIAKLLSKQTHLPPLIFSLQKNIIISKQFFFMAVLLGPMHTLKRSFFLQSPPL